MRPIYTRTFSIVAMLLLAAGLLAGEAVAQTKKPRKIPAAGSKSLDQPEAEKPASSKPAAQSYDTPRPANKVKKVMITDFDARGIAKWWGSNWDIGSLFANSIIGPLSRTQNYEVVERSRMNEIFNELKLSESERFTQSAVTKAGRQLGADYILFGFLTDFTRKKSDKFLYKEISAQISFSVRMVDIATGKVFKSAEINYVSPKQKDIALTGKNGEINPNDPEFLQSLFGKAISEASKNAVAQLTGEGTPAPAPGGSIAQPRPDSGDNNAPAVVDGKVADITGNVVTINRGRQSGVKEGQFFVVVKVVKEIKDPDSGQIISRKTEELVRLKVTKVDDGASECIVVSGSASALEVGTQVSRTDSKKP